MNRIDPGLFMDCFTSVSYTHLDVYKRQHRGLQPSAGILALWVSLREGATCQPLVVIGGGGANCLLATSLMAEERTRMTCRWHRRYWLQPQLEVREPEPARSEPARASDEAELCA